MGKRPAPRAQSMAEQLRPLLEKLVAERRAEEEGSALDGIRERAAAWRRAALDARAGLLSYGEHPGDVARHLRAARVISILDEVFSLAASTYSRPISGASKVAELAAEGHVALEMVSCMPPPGDERAWERLIEIVRWSNSAAVFEERIKEARARLATEAARKGRSHLQVAQEWLGAWQINLKDIARRNTLRRLRAEVFAPPAATKPATPSLTRQDVELVLLWGLEDLRSRVMDAMERGDFGELIEGLTSQDYNRLRARLSARQAERVALAVYRALGRQVQDVAITQVPRLREQGAEHDKSLTGDSPALWALCDLRADGVPIDLKNTQRSPKRPQSYRQHLVRRFKGMPDGSAVCIAGVASYYIPLDQLLPPFGAPLDPALQPVFLGETSRQVLERIVAEFSDGELLTVRLQDEAGEAAAFLAPWLFDLPPGAYTVRDRAIEQVAALNRETPISSVPDIGEIMSLELTAGLHGTHLMAASADDWRSTFIGDWQLVRSRHGLSLPFLFYTVLRHFLRIVRSDYLSTGYQPRAYRALLYSADRTMPLGIYDPLRTVDALIGTLDELWTHSRAHIAHFKAFRLTGFRVLRGRPLERSGVEQTLVANCRLCSQYPLVFGREQTCQAGFLVCSQPTCGYCCPACQGGPSGVAGWGED